MKNQRPFLAKDKFPGYFDHTLLKPGARENEIRNLCEAALKYQFASVCVNPSYIALCVQLLKNSGVKVCTVVGFPLGATTTSVKAYEARKAMQLGAQEIDMVLNIGGLKDDKEELVYKDIFEVVKECRLKNAVSKVILETGLLTDEEKALACRIVRRAGAHYVKTSTGFGPGGATVEDVKLMKEAVKGSRVRVKASGGIRSFEDAVSMIEAGASRLGTSSTEKIMKEYLQKIH